jgi:hypothetical protein
LGSFAFAVYVLKTLENTMEVVSESIYVAFIGVSVFLGIAIVFSMLGSILSFSSHRTPGLIIVVSLVFLWMCEFVLGIYIELKRNEQGGFLGIPSRLQAATPNVQTAVMTEHNMCVVENLRDNTSSRYGCRGAGLDPNDQSCNFVVSDRYCLLTMILEIALLVLLLAQIAGGLSLGVHLKMIWHQGGNSKVHPISDPSTP